MTSTSITAVYSYDASARKESISFDIGWKATAKVIQRSEIQSEQSAFELSVEIVKDKFSFNFFTAESDFTLLQDYQRFSMHIPFENT